MAHRGAPTRSRPPGGVTTTTVVGGSQGIGMDMGAETETVTLGVSTSMAQGTETESMGFTPAATVSQGTETESVAVSATGTATYPQGTESAAMTIGVTQTRATGTESESFSADATAFLSQHTTTATATQNSGTTNWTNPTNAQGAINGTEAGINYAPVTETQTDATLKCSGLVVTATPSGFTRTAVGIRIVHRWDLTITGAVAGLIDAINTIELRDSAGALIATLNQRLASGGAGTQATLLTEDYDITALVSEAQLSAGVQIWCNANYDFAAVGGNASWQVDACHLRASYTRSGIT